VHPHLVQLLVDGGQYGRHIELSPSVRGLQVSGFQAWSLLAPCGDSFSVTTAALRGASPCANTCVHTCCNWGLFGAVAQFVLECLHTRGAERRPAIFGGAAAVRPLPLPASSNKPSAAQQRRLRHVHMDTVHARVHPSMILAWCRSLWAAQLTRPPKSPSWQPTCQVGCCWPCETGFTCFADVERHVADSMPILGHSAVFCLRSIPCGMEAVPATSFTML
jgi:hypothetical protein